MIVLFCFFLYNNTWMDILRYPIIQTTRSEKNCNPIIVAPDTQHCDKDKKGNRSQNGVIVVTVAVVHLAVIVVMIREGVVIKGAGETRIIVIAAAAAITLLAGGGRNSGSWRSQNHLS